MSRRAPLHGLRVLAVSQFGAGPFGTQLLADLGADIIKIEDPAVGGDVARAVGPFAADGDSLYFQSFNRGKRSITLDLKHTAGQAVLHDLVRVSHAVYNNLRGDLPASAGPVLLWNGRPVEDHASESISRVFGLARHPRTAIGERADGSLVLVTVDGRAPERSVGMSLPELTSLLLELGAVSALNLDGGGSTAMVIGGRLVNTPSDPAGERANGDALLVFPRRSQGDQ